MTWKQVWTVFAIEGTAIALWVGFVVCTHFFFGWFS